MDNSSVIGSPRIAQISHSAQQFKQLIDSLRSKKHVTPSPTTSEPPSVIEHKSCATTNTPELVQPAMAQSEGSEGELTLRRIPKKFVGGRDTLKQLSSTMVDATENNPEIVLPAAPLRKHASKNIYVQVTTPEPSPPKNAGTQCDKEYGTQIEPSFLVPSHSHSQSPTPSTHLPHRGGSIKKQNLGFEKSS